MTEKPLHGQDPTVQNHLAQTWQQQLAEGQALVVGLVTVLTLLVQN